MRRTAGKHLRDHAAHGNAGNVRAFNSQFIHDAFGIGSHIFKTIFSMHGAARDVLGDAREHTRLAHGFRTEHTRSAVSVIRRNDIEPLAYQTREERLRPGSGIHP